jgi:hypothetical protein
MASVLVVLRVRPGAATAGMAGLPAAVVHLPRLPTRSAGAGCHPHAPGISGWAGAAAVPQVFTIAGAPGARGISAIPPLAGLGHG